MPRAVRAEFPVFDHRPEGFHYLDSAATGQICRAAADALLTFETQNRANVKRGIYPLAEAATEAFADARRAVADYLGVADADEVILTSGTTLGINLFAHAFGARLGDGDEIVLSELEHHSNIVPWQLLRERTGATIRVLPVTDEGRLDLDRLEEIVTERCKVDRGDPRVQCHRRAHRLRRIVAAARAVGARVLRRRRPAGAARAARRAGARRRRLRHLRPQDVRPDRRRRALGARASCSPSCRRSWAAAR